MYLSKLEIVGFKSFADKTTLTFQDGLCAIVGPNGVGKTNFVDAIRWVLGEQKTSVLRSESMENVIFNGSKHRKPLGMAEVSITIINNKKILPSEFDEINISRRLYRDGDSQYLINKQNARLKDIQNLFMDSGLGADSYSVIELKMIENLLNGNVADRREIFEEAAGIKKFKQNRKEATKKLQVVSLDIDRINDILQEVQKNVNSLSRQASKTRKYNQLINELRELELKLLTNEYLANIKTVQQKQENLEKLKYDLNQLQNNFSEIEQYVFSLKSNYKSIDEKYQNTIKKEIELNAKLSDIAHSIKLNEEKIKNIDTNQITLEKEIKDSENYIKRNTENLAKLSEEYKNTLANQEKLSQLLSKEQARELEIKDKFNKVQNELNQLQNKKSQLINRKNYLETISQRNKQNQDKINRRLEEEQSKILRYQQQLSELQQNSENLLTQKEDLNKTLVQLRDELKQLNQQKIESEKIIEDARNKELDLRRKLHEKMVEKKFLESIALPDESIKVLLSNNEWIDNSDKLLLGEIINVDPKYQKAVLIALEDLIDSLIVEDFETAHKGITVLEQSKKGLASFLIPQKNDEKHNTNEIQENGVLGRLIDFIEIKEEYQNLLNFLAGNILVADTYENAVELNKLDKFDKIVTLDGILLNRNGLVRGGGSNQSHKEAIIGRRNKINKLSKEIDELEKSINQLASIIKNEQSKIWQFDIPQKENEIKNLERKINSLANEIVSVTNRIEITKNSLQNTQSVITQLTAELEEIGNEKDTNRNEIIAIEEDVENINNQINEVQKTFVAVQNDLNEQIKKIRIIEIDFAKGSETSKYLNSEIEKITALTENAKKRNNEKILEIEKNTKEKQILNNQILSDLETKNHLQIELEKLINEKRDIENSRKALQEQINQYDDTLNQYRKNIQKLNNEIHQIELEIASILSKIELINKNSQEQYQINIDNFIAQNETQVDTNFNFDEAKAKIAEIKEKISSLGNINFQALEDFEEQKQRLDFLLTQMNDLQNSRKTLTDTIEEINKIAVQKFNETFEKIRVNFKHLFKLLFGEDGEADLTLDSNNVLEAGINISAKPPFKKPSSIDLLSAGEKTLTAIALLFSIYLVKPSPFCILDEVDAPLDDSNIDKFVNLIKKFSAEKDIQFILITHNKRTMEAADVLYGLTMEEEGVTKIVSVKLEK